jgi:hypothetical protein
MTSAFIPARFRRAVGLHIVKNLMPPDIARAPLILGIHGPSGDGKTFLCEHVLQEMGVRAFLISGGQLESHAAGEPANLVRETYIRASRSIEKGECPSAAILINDIDTGLGDWGEMVQYTINRQTVFGELMHLVDYPTSVEGRDTKRIPIIMTGNDFTKLYEPLVRAGRMTAFEWMPTLEERAQIVSRIFPEISGEECRTLILESDSLVSDPDRHLPVAFYSFLRWTLVDDTLWGEVERVGLSRTIFLLSEGTRPNLSIDVDINLLLLKGRELIGSGRLINHLRRK